MIKGGRLFLNMLIDSLRDRAGSAGDDSMGP
jgi:hypothetical protein